MAVDRRGAQLLYLGAALSVILGVVLAFRQFPGGFDWAYTVISKLASNRQNPDGARWLSGSLLVAMILLWPVVRHFAQRFEDRGDRPRIALAGLHVGVGAGVLLAFEGLLHLDLSRLARKGHEILAIFAFLGFYVGVLGLHLHRVRHAAASVWPALLVILPLVAVGVTQVALYFDQRELGWVNTGWRELGVPLWLSFAFWQWLAVAFLGVGLGLLVASDRRNDARAPGLPDGGPSPSRTRARR